MRSISLIPTIVKELRELDSDDLSILANVLVNDMPEEADKLRAFLVFADMDKHLIEAGV